MNHYKNKNFKKPKQQYKKNYTKTTKERYIPNKFINFCTKKCIELPNEIKNIIHNNLIHNYRFQQKNISELNLSNINSNYLLTIDNPNKYNFLLFLTTINNKKYSVFIYNNRGVLHFFSVKFRFNDELYNGTLFKGELIKNETDCWIYYISDLIYYKNTYFYENKLSYKLKTIASVLKNEYVFDDFMNVCHLQIKSYFLFNHLEFIKNNCKLLFIPEQYNNNIYYCDLEFPKKKTILINDNDEKTFKIKKTDVIDVYELYDINTGRFDSIACVSKLSTSLFLRENFKNKNEFIIKTLYSTYFKSWVPMI